MKKIVELLIDWDNVEMEDLGVDVMSIVDSPAIGIDFLAFAEEQVVDNTGFEKFEKFINANIDLFKKPGVGAAGDSGVNHAEQMKLLNEAGIDTEFPFGYCYQVAQFLFYAMGGYNGDYDLKCIKGMQYKVNKQDFQSTHWYIQHKETNNIVDLTASQFDGILDINDYYSEGKRANLGYPYYNVGDDRVEFDTTVPSFQTLKLYSKWKEDYSEIEELEKYYVASQYEQLRKDFAIQEFVEPKSGESEADYVSRCIPVLIGEGYEEDQATAICYSSYELDFDLDEACWPGYEAIGVKKLNGKTVPNCVPVEAQKFVDEELEEEQKKFLKLAEQLGEQIDWEFTTYIDGAQKEFSTVSDWVEGVQGLDILSRRGLGGEMQVKYRYAGPPAQRNFCKAMQRLDKLYTYQELQEMGRNVGNGIDRGSQAIIKWKGGPNCSHFFEKVLVSKEGRQTVIISEGRATQQELGIAMDQRPNNGYRMSFAFSTDDEMIVTGPAMVPQQLILRKDEMGNPFHVYFSQDTIKKIAKKFFEYNKMNNTDINHDDNVTTGNTLLESWIVEDPNMDKSKAMGFNVPKSTWMVSYKINDEETWNKIKNGELNGYSIAGNFIEKAAKL